MKTGELAEELGFNKLHIGRVRRKVNPDHSGGDLEKWEVEAIKKNLGITSDKNRKRLIGVFCDDRYDGFIEACNLERTEKHTVAIPYNYKPSDFLGREFWVDLREYGNGQFVYTYNPYRQDD